MNITATQWTQHSILLNSTLTILHTLYQTSHNKNISYILLLKQTYPLVSK